MGSYELRDLDHIGVGYLYEGKLVIDKGWGHGYYGCAGCCGFETVQLTPNPNAGSIGTQAGNFLQAYDACTASYVDVTSEGYQWASSNSGIVTLANSYSSFVSVGSANGSGQVRLQEQLARLNCPAETYEPQNAQNALPCPTTVSVTKNSAIKWTPGQGTACSSTSTASCLTGVGSDVLMTAGASGQNYDGVQLTESLKQGTGGTCPQSVTNLIGDICNGQPGPLTVGIGTTDPSGTTLTATSNAFWDIHAFFASQDTLGLAGVSGSCTVVCTQSYSCAKSALSPSFTITYTLTHTTTGSGTPVTQVTVAKEAAQ